MVTDHLVDDQNEITPFEHQGVGKNAINFGLIIAVVVVIYSLLLWVLDQTFNMYLSPIGMVIMIGGLIYSIWYYKHKINNGFLDIGKGILSGIITSAVIGVLVGLFNFILNNYIDPELYLRSVDMVYERWGDRIPDDQATYDMAVERAKRATGFVRSMISGIFGYMFFGFLTALIYSAIVKKTPDTIH